MGSTIRRVAVLLGILAAFSCASAPRSPEAVAAPAAEASRFRALHPQGYSAQETRLLFERGGAPIRLADPGFREFQEGCGSDYQAEKSIARTKEELFSAFPEHVRARREHYHWCFYAQLLALQELLGEDLAEPGLGDAVPPGALDRFSFLTHLARVFEVDFEDGSYLRQAAAAYRRFSERYYPGSPRLALPN
ncbi:MAG: hypothetical protein NDJ89_07380 [Oligoflexia bacterium]|nr:hypothetical protein [Oligoflexia bacterium]